MVGGGLSRDSNCVGWASAAAVKGKPFYGAERAVVGCKQPTLTITL